jgi:hypothetical protein
VINAPVDTAGTGKTTEKTKEQRMKKVSVAIVVLLLALGVAWAQQQPPTSDSSTGTPTSGGNQITVQGCLGGGPGNFTLLSSDGMTYQLQGNDRQLKEHVGHTVAVTGMPGTGNSTTSSATPTSPSGTSPSGTTGEERTLSVSSLKHISSSCSETSTTGSPKQ